MFDCATATSFGMKFSELKNKNQKELQEILHELKIKLGKLNFELGQNKLTDSSQMGKTKKDIARIMTALNIKHET